MKKQNALRAAIYARYSTDKQTESSIKDQVRVCTEWAKASGMKIADVFKDEGISGAAMGNRPGFLAMMEAANAGRFKVLIVMELSRLSRNQGDLPKSLERLAHRGVRVVGVQDGYDSERKGHKLQAGFSGIMGEAFRDMISDKTYVALQTRAKAGKPTGGKCYGYRKSGEVDPAQARVVCEIFKLYAIGWSPRRIADELNRRRVPSPGSEWNRTNRRKDGRWLASVIYGDPKRGSGMLNNEIYHGVKLWNRSQSHRDPETGKRVFKRRRPDECVRVDVPHLRIVPEALWKQVRERQAERVKRIGERVRKGLAKSAAGRGPKYLLSGILRCGKCDANAVVTGAYQTYCCATHTNGGEHACDNDLSVTRAIVETRVLDELRANLADPVAFKEFEREARRVLRERRDSKGEDEANRARRIAELEKVVANVTDAIVRGGLKSPALGARLTEAERELKELTAGGQEEPKGVPITAMLPRALERYRALVSDLNKALRRDIPRARTLLQEYFDGGVVRLVPNKSGTALDALYRIDGRRLLKSLTGGQGNIMMVAGAGFEPATFGL